MKVRATVDADAITAEAFDRDYVRPVRPVLITGLVRDWPATGACTPGYLADYTEAVGDVDVTYRSTPDGAPSPEQQSFSQGVRSLLDILRECEASPDEGPELYIPGLDIPTGGSLIEDLGLPGLIPAGKVHGSSIFFGRNTRCVAHYHPHAQALLCQVQGVKQVWMYPPGATGRQRLFPPWSGRFFASRIDFHADGGRRLAGAAAPAQLFELHPGDALFIPLHWLHAPRGRGWSVSVTHFWPARPTEWRPDLTAAHTLAAMGFRAVRRLLARRAPA
jgi:hypothetical protein